MPSFAPRTVSFRPGGQMEALRGLWDWEVLSSWGCLSSGLLIAAYLQHSQLRSMLIPATAVCTARCGPFDVPGRGHQLHPRIKGLQLMPGASCLLSLLLLPSASTFCSISAGTAGNTRSITTSQAFLAGLMTESKVEAHPFLSC